MAAIAAVCLGVGALGGYRLGAAQEPEVVVQPLPLTEEERSTIALFRAARETVVSISTSDRVVDPWTRRTFDQPAGSGSGFVWDARGHIVTNNHVIEGRSRATVTLADGRSFDARLVGRDPAHDLAVLRIEGDALPAPLPLGLSRDLEVGQDVLAIGNPFGLDWTLTTGIVSALDRELPTGRGGAVRGLIQTDAAINPGNSGGPLLDSAGRLIGVNTAIFSPSGASAGIGFAIPVGSVRRVVPQLIETGRYAPPTLGILVDARINAAVNRQGLPGVLVLGAEPGSPAAAAGLETARLDRSGRIVPGDIVTAVDDTPVETLDDFLAALDLRAPGESVTLTLRNGRRERTLELELAPG
ncbi:serine protease, putative [Oceanicola granulosus HTCC2516]|uniref:Serine protease, putative n=1 Tax=Oceanicola granulosus (strain ATCC BAA-861 / DSM 15982 / KCTC 12143 / HTCC2516) TaxID=314256 RepID=Q2CD93_OCEGH|nr:serine protease, putative [Oceanicola granulosus HTCC2516]